MEHYEETDPNDARTFAHRGELHRQGGRYAEALADLDQAIELRPDYTWAIAHRAETFRLMGSYKKALINFDCAIERIPDYSWALAHRGVLHRTLRAHEKSLADLTRAVELKPNYAWALAHRGNTLTVLKRYEAALVDLERSIAIDPSLTPSWPGECGLLTNYLGRYAETIVRCQQWLAQNPTDYIAMYSLAVATMLAQQNAAAQQIIAETTTLLHNMLQQQPISFEIRAAILYRLGGLAALQKCTDQALDYLKEAVALDYEPGEMARHDPAWFDLRADRSFQATIAVSA